MVVEDISRLRDETPVSQRLYALLRKLVVEDQLFVPKLEPSYGSRMRD